MLVFEFFLSIRVSFLVVGAGRMPRRFAATAVFEKLNQVFGNTLRCNVLPISVHIKGVGFSLVWLKFSKFLNIGPAKELSCFYLRSPTSSCAQQILKQTGAFEAPSKRSGKKFQLLRVFCFRPTLKWHLLQTAVNDAHMLRLLAITRQVLSQSQFLFLIFSTFPTLDPWWLFVVFLRMRGS